MTDDLHLMESDPLDLAFVVGVLEIDLHLPLCRSLKAKRGILKKTINHLRKKHQVSVAEVGAHDTWGRAGVVAVAVSGDADTATSVLRAAARTLQTDREVQVVNYSIHTL